MSPQEYESFRAFLESACGILLGDNKQYLITSRLNSLLAEYRIPTIGALIERLHKDPRSALCERIVDAMTTNETLWFRDAFPFEILRQVILPELVKARAQGARIWSAACSSGQEPYSISMIIEEFQRASPGALANNVQIIATDLSPSMLDLSRAGSYDAAAMARGISDERRRQFFTEHFGRWQLNEEVRRRVTFREHNLQQGCEPLGKFQVIFCRNVLIYFSAVLKRSILARFAAALQPGGYLFLGAAEAITGYSDDFEMLRLPQGIVYRLKRAPARPTTG
ncbi:MAG TPA: protein-glutamate O-methyltransferase CheR [Acidiferrobacterales bacterium]|nr:protein-glutamate O-methyltransferase CheR [Acidiferrobacterales bacterium]